MPFSPERANHALQFFAQLKHTKGKWAGSPFNLLPWQRDELISPLFGTLNADGTRQYRTVYCEVPRKQGKSELIAGLGLYLLLADGEQGPEVYCAAADRDQASLVFGAAAHMVRSSPGLSRRLKVIDSTKRIVVISGKSTGGVLKAIPADAAGSHGFNASAVVMDEVHVQPNRDLWDVLMSSMGAREQPVGVGITTAGFDRNSLCWELHEHARQVRDEVLEDPSFLPVLYSADVDDDWLSEEVWRKANPSLGITVPLEFYQQEARKAQQMPAYENTFRRLYLNQWTSNETRFIPMNAWDACDQPVGDLAGRSCYLGLDLASTTDIAALALVFPPTRADSGPFEVLLRFWVPRQNMVERGRRDRVPYELWEKQGLITATEGNVIDYSFIRREIESLRRRYRVEEIAFDPWGAVQMAQELQESGANMVEFRQGYASLSEPTKELLRLVLDRRLRHNNHPVLRWMADNVMVETDPAGNLKPSRRKSTEKIDGIVALIMGLGRAIRHIDRRPRLLGTA